jgi:hypothetical protein
MCMCIIIPHGEESIAVRSFISLLLCSLDGLGECFFCKRKSLGIARGRWEKEGRRERWNRFLYMHNFITR